MPDDLPSTNNNGEGWQTNYLFPVWKPLGPQFYDNYRTDIGFPMFQAAMDAALISYYANTDMVGLYPVSGVFTGLLAIVDLKEIVDLSAMHNSFCRPYFSALFNIHSQLTSFFSLFTLWITLRGINSASSPCRSLLTRMTALFTLSAVSSP